MTGLGYKQFTDGVVATALEANGYLMEQAVMRFASETARDTALAGVFADGMVAYTADAGILWVRRSGAWVEIGVPRVKYKTADTTRSNTTSLATDPDLTHSGIEIGTYIFDMRLIFSASAVADWKGFLTATGSITSRLFTSLRKNGGVIAYDHHEGAVTFAADGAGVGTKQGINITGSFVATAAGQAFDLQWAQNTAEVSNTVLHAGSYYRIQRVG